MQLKLICLELELEVVCLCNIRSICW